MADVTWSQAERRPEAVDWRLLTLSGSQASCSIAQGRLRERSGDVTIAVRHTASADAVAKLLDRIREVPGYVYPFHTYMAEHDYSWLEAHQTWYEQIRAPRWLPLKYKELLFLTAALIKLFETGVRTHTKKALELGATPNEILETIEVAAHTGGGGVPVLAVRVLIEVLEDRDLAKGPAWVGAETESKARENGPSRQTARQRGKRRKG